MVNIFYKLMVKIKQFVLFLLNKPNIGYISIDMIVNEERNWQATK